MAAARRQPPYDPARCAPRRGPPGSVARRQCYLGQDQRLLPAGGKEAAHSGLFHARTTDFWYTLIHCFSLLHLSSSLSCSPHLSFQVCSRSLLVSSCISHIGFVGRFVVWSQVKGAFVPCFIYHGTGRRKRRRTSSSSTCSSSSNKGSKRKCQISSAHGQKPKVFSKRSAALARTPPTFLADMLVAWQERRRRSSQICLLQRFVGSAHSRLRSGGRRRD